MAKFDFAVIGGGIVGLASAWALIQRHPQASILVLEKEATWAKHQTGHNSGVIHSGIYYKPGSLKATLSREGSISMVEFCQLHGIPYETCGKVIVATEAHELPQLETLYERGIQNGLAVEKLGPAGVRDLEPHVRCLAGIRVPSTGITDYRQVCQKLAELLRTRGAQLQLETKVIGIQPLADGQRIDTDKGPFDARMLINCGGLHSDRIAKLANLSPDARIVPFRGEYYELKPERRQLVRGLVYPVPNPDFPFLGVHFTRMIDGSVHAGPNAVLSLKREGYRKTDLDWQDLRETLTYPGFWRLASRHLGEGLKETYRSLSKQAFVKSLQRLIPEVQAEDLTPCAAGVRAQAMTNAGQLVDDFLIAPSPRALHVCNAPSPAATSSLEIGRRIVQLLPA